MYVKNHPANSKRKKRNKALKKEDCSESLLTSSLKKQVIEPVFLTSEYDENGVAMIVRQALDFGIAICTRIDHTSPNGLPTTLDVRLSPGQIRQIWQERPQAILLEFKLSDSTCVFSNVGINGLLINKPDADFVICYKQSTVPTVMLPYQRQANKTKRIDQITKLYTEIGTKNPIRINTDKIKKPIESINLGWVLAICQMDYMTLAEVSFDNPTLDSLANHCISKINSILTESGKNLDIPKCCDEYDFPTLTVINKINSYTLEPEVVLELIVSHPDFNCFTESPITTSQIESPRSIPPNSLKAQIETLINRANKAERWFNPYNADLNNQNKRAAHTILEPSNSEKESASIQKSKELKNSNDKTKKKFESKLSWALKNDKNRPNHTAKGKTQNFYQEAEEVLIAGSLNTINIESIWQRIMKKTEDGQSQFELTSKFTIKDKDTNNTFDKDKAAPHLRKVVQWYIEVKNSLTT